VISPEAAASAPATTSSGARSPPSASTATRIMERKPRETPGGYSHDVELDKHRVRALNMRESRWRVRFAGWTGIVCGLLLVVAAAADSLGTGVFVAAVMSACGVAMVVFGRRRWRLEDPGYRPPRSFYVRAAVAFFALAVTAFVAAGVFAAYAGALFPLGLIVLMLGGFALVRVRRGPI
jgi:hypothetical protein